MKLFAAITAAALLAGPMTAFAANARNPYGNIDRRVDAGNDTGDSQVDRLNAQQLSRGPIGSRPFHPYPPIAYAPPPVYYPAPYVIVPRRPYYGYGW